MSPHKEQLHAMVCVILWFKGRWVSDSHHGDIVKNHEKEYYERLNRFIEHCLQPSSP